MFTECLRNLRTERPLRVHVSLLIGSAALERSLGDVSLSLVYGSNCLNFAFTNDPVYTPVGIPCCVQGYITALQGAALLVTIMIAALFVCVFVLFHSCSVPLVAKRPACNRRAGEGIQPCCSQLKQSPVNPSRYQPLISLPHKLSCLRCLIGPPSGLNLRNILWHGFAAGDEIPEE